MLSLLAGGPGTSLAWFGHHPLVPTLLVLLWQPAIWPVPFPLVWLLRPGSPHALLTTSMIELTGGVTDTSPSGAQIIW